jgi:hypothetical protein
MRKIVLGLVLSLLWSGVASAEKNKFELWLNSFGLPKPIVQDKNFYFGISYDGQPSKLLNNVEILISMINEDVYSKDKRYLTRYGCKPRDCGNKGFLWIDSKKKVAIGVIKHNFWEKLDFKKRKKDQVFIFSNFFEDSKELPDEFVKTYSAWIKKHNFKPPLYRFLNSKNELKIISGIK